MKDREQYVLRTEGSGSPVSCVAVQNPGQATFILRFDSSPPGDWRLELLEWVTQKAEQVPGVDRVNGIKAEDEVDVVDAIIGRVTGAIDAETIDNLNAAIASAYREVLGDSAPMSITTIYFTGEESMNRWFDELNNRPNRCR